MGKLRIDNVVLRFTPRMGRPVTALDRISLEVDENEFSVIVGPSGCGKSSLLRLVAGLIQPTAGAIYLDGKMVTRPGKDRGMVFQSYTLFPWLTVQDNLEFGLKLGSMAAEERAAVAIDIPRPRSVGVLTADELIVIKRRIMALIHEEAVRAMS